MGRTTKGLTLMESIVASRQAHERAKAILLTVTRDWSIQEALEHLGIGRTRFAQLREQMFQGALGALESGPTGRPPKAPAPREAEVARLREQVQELRGRLRCARTELELLKGPAREAVLAHQGGGR